MTRQPEPAYPGIYQIRCLIDGKIYVGSAVSIRIRWKGHRFHLNRGTHDNRHLQSAWRKHGRTAFVFEVLQAVEDKADLIRIEQEWLDRLQSYRRGVGYNISPTAGSPLGFKHTPEARAKISEIKKNQSAETRAKIGEASKRRVWTDEMKAKISRANKKRSPELIAKIAATRIGRIPSAESRAKMSASKMGRKHTAESRAKIGAANKGKVRTPEMRARLSATKKEMARLSKMKTGQLLLPLKDDVRDGED